MNTSMVVNYVWNFFKDAKIEKMERFIILWNTSGMSKRQNVCIYWLKTQTVKLWWKYKFPSTNSVHYVIFFQTMCNVFRLEVLQIRQKVILYLSFISLYKIFIPIIKIAKVFKKWPNKILAYLYALRHAIQIRVGFASSAVRHCPQALDQNASIFY